MQNSIKLSNPIPTLEEAEKIVKDFKGFKRPLNGFVLLLSPLTPFSKAYSNSIIALDSATQKERQIKKNFKDGLLVVQSPFLKQEGVIPDSNTPKVFAGERVLTSVHADLSAGKVISTTTLLEGLTQEMVDADLERIKKTNIPVNNLLYYRHYTLFMLRAHDLMYVLD
jgi:hypothetical protein